MTATEEVFDTWSDGAFSLLGWKCSVLRQGAMYNCVFSLTCFESEGALFDRVGDCTLPGLERHSGRPFWGWGEVRVGRVRHTVAGPRVPMVPLKCLSSHCYRCSGRMLAFPFGPFREISMGVLSGGLGVLKERKRTKLMVSCLCVLFQVGF